MKQFESFNFQIIETESMIESVEEQIRQLQDQIAQQPLT